MGLCSSTPTPHLNAPRVNATASQTAPQNRVVASAPPPPYEEEVYELPATTINGYNSQFHKLYPSQATTLAELDLILLVDHSGSQKRPDRYPIDGVRTPVRGIFPDRWCQYDNTYLLTRHLFNTIQEVHQQYHSAFNGVPMYMFGRDVSYQLVHNHAELDTAFRTHIPTQYETTDLESALSMAFTAYIPKPFAANGRRRLFVVLTDGEPNPGQHERIRQLIYTNLTSVDPQGDYLNILFIRIGDDPKAIAFLTDMDDNTSQQFVIANNTDHKSDNQAFRDGGKTLFYNAVFELPATELKYQHEEANATGQYRR